MTGGDVPAAYGAAYSRRVATPAGPDGLAALFVMRPDYAAALGSVWDEVWAQDAVDTATLELCRLRIGQLLGTEPRAERVPTELLAVLRGWPTAPEFDHRARTALEYAEQLVIDAQNVDDALAAAVIAEFGAAGFLVLGYACGLFETVVRAQLVTSALFPAGSPG
jgi:alkylhydroperoxidase family enzyme